jgi:hypothetical protein
MKYNKIIGSSSITYVDEVVKKYMESRDIEDIEVALNSALELDKEMKNCEAEVLKVVGFGDEWREVSDVTQRVETLVKWLEDVLTHAMVNGNDVVRFHQLRLLLFQSNRL